MPIFLTEEEEIFQQEARDFLRANLADALSFKVKNGISLSRDEYLSWHRKVNEKGWVAPHWPSVHGGAGWSIVQRYIWQIESAMAYAPRTLTFGTDLLGPILIHFGSDEQRAHWLPRILSAEDWWCQGFSEPGAGSDLASLTTRAARDGGDYVVTGQKTWTTYGHYSNMMFALVRTNSAERKQRGIGFILIDMTAPGVTVRPLITLEGEHEVNEVFLDNVRVPAANMVGDPEDGWSYAKFLLTNERTGQAGVGEARMALAALRDLTGRLYEGDRSLCDDPLFAHRFAQAEIAVDNLATTAMRTVAAVANGAPAGVESSMLKVKGSEVRQQIADLTRRVLGPLALPLDTGRLRGADALLPELRPELAAAASKYFNGRKLSIYGGSNEIQRTIIGRALIGV